ncbi:MAG: O-antigen ligase family protein [Balneolaceae bacterium]
MLIFHYNNYYLKLFAVASIVVFIFFIYYSIGNTYYYGFSKSFLAFLIPLWSSVVLLGIRWNESEIPDLLVDSILLIVVFAVAYKYEYGFYNRNVRFGIVGPIPFGWLCAIGLLSNYKNLVVGKIFKFIVISMIFAIGLLWSGSKSPFIGIMLASAYGYLAIPSERKRIPIILFTLLCVVSAYYFFGFESRAIDNIADFYQDADVYVDGSGAGSIGVRFALYDMSFELVKKSPFFGVGVGGWADALNMTRILYPHNAYIEVLSEGGITLFFIFMLYFLIIFIIIKKKRMIVLPTIIIFYLSVINFSGDLSYFRYAAYFVVLGCITRRDVSAYSTDEKYNA